VVKRRALAKEMCDKGMVRVNGKTVKAGKELSVGDVVEIDTLTRYFKFRVLEIPQGKNVSKKKAKELIEVIEDRKKDIREIIDLI